MSISISIETLSNLKASLKDGLIIHVFVKNMDDFARVNSVYRTFITVNPPARQVTAWKRLSAFKSILNDINRKQPRFPDPFQVSS